MTIPRIVCVTLRGEYERAEYAPGVERPGPRSKKEIVRAHYAERGVHPTDFYGFNAQKLGLRTVNVYERDVPGSNWNMGPHPTGCWLSHRALWAALLLCADDAFFVIEDDARFPGDWHDRLTKAMAHLPADWDLCWVGSCCTGGPRAPGWRPVGGEVYEGGLPLCTHGYLVRRKALAVLIDTQDDAACYGPVDVTLTLHSMPKLRTFTVLPRILDQFDTNLPE